MSTDRRRADARRRAWGRGPVILRFEPLESRQLLSATPMPDLVPVAFSTAHNVSWGGSFHATGTVANQGTAVADSAFVVNIYASPTPTIGSNSVLLGQATIPTGLIPGAQASYDQQVSLPLKPLSGVNAAGTVYIETVINPVGGVTESNTANNSGGGQGVDLSVMTATAATPASLTGMAVTVSTSALQWGQTFQLNAQIGNTSTGNAPPTRARVVLTPSGATPGGDSDVTIGNIDVPAVGAGQAVVVTQNVTLPSYPPATLGSSTGFTLSVVQDADFLTNPVSPHAASNGAGYDQTSLTIAAPTAARNVSRPNLSVTNVMAPSTALTIGQDFQVTATLQNTGKSDAGPFRVRYLLVGSDGSTSSAIFLGDTTVTGLGVGAVENVTQTLQLPLGVANYLTSSASTSQARIAVVVDPEHALDLPTRANTTKVSPLVKLKLVATDGTTTTVPTTTTTTATTSASGMAVAKAAAAAKKAAAAARLARAKKKFAPKPHSLEHNLKVFPTRVGKFFTDLFKGK